ncbi:hydroxysqualene dehydroxylase HpnE [Snodgrassella sp. CFCC 13594]|uniref:hydroxysqualene dehydroxylase HpnE n=1 Tax=Snodgrassella sp. CFCC 13594 TaxID=1775559 RepID=UPI00082CEA70|nr:hydroxysqualene dehydroxylase HpnE [Snodgrassella sp. CFCC 13594]
MNRRKVAVIGGGWAGMAAAEALAGKTDVVLLEAGKVLGGRARAVRQSHHDFSFIDNGQHMLLGAYHQCLGLLQRAGVDAQAVLHRERMSWYQADGFRFQAARWRSPWHLLVGIIKGRGATVREKWQLLKHMRRLQVWHRGAVENGQDMTVAQWLESEQVAQKWQQQFWQPLVWGALNTALREASLLRLGNVLQDGVWSTRANSDMVLPKTDLGQSWVEPVAGLLRRKKVVVETARRVSALSHAGEGHGVWVDDDYFDAVVLAVAPYHASQLLPRNVPGDVSAALSSLAYHAITTVYLRYEQNVDLPATLTGLAHGKVQWFIGRGRLGGDNNEVTAVISLADAPAHRDVDWAQVAHQELLNLCPLLSHPVAVRVITEKRATVSCCANRQPIPQAWLRQHDIYLAGDYVHDRYPCTLEGAVQSGQLAAAALLADAGRPAMAFKRL